MNNIQEYNNLLAEDRKQICDFLAEFINNNLKFTESKIWHKNPVWFIEGNPVVGYANLKGSVQLLFWSGQSFNEENLQTEGTFKAAQIRYTDINQINESDLKQWLKKASEIQWDYKNIVKKRGVLERLQ